MLACFRFLIVEERLFNGLCFRKWRVGRGCQHFSKELLGLLYWNLLASGVLGNRVVVELRAFRDLGLFWCFEESDNVAAEQTMFFDTRLRFRASGISLTYLCKAWLMPWTGTLARRRGMETPCLRCLHWVCPKASKPKSQCKVQTS